VEQFAAMPAGARADFELVEGELVPLAQTPAKHNWIWGRLNARLVWYLDHSPIGTVLAETDCRTGDSVRRPDVSFYRTARWNLVDPERFPLPFPPDFAVEVLSPSNTYMEVDKKVHEYLAHGSSEVWIIDPDVREVLIRRAGAMRVLGPGHSITSPLLPGFSIPAAELFSGPGSVQTLPENR